MPRPSKVTSQHIPIQPELRDLLDLIARELADEYIKLMRAAPVHEQSTED
jgi:hypothetical protein